MLISAVGSLFQLLLASFGAVGGPDVAVVTLGAVVLAVLIALMLAIVRPRSAHTAPSRPRRAIDVSVAVAQSDPDAAGHPRSRAPGFAASAA